MTMTHPTLRKGSAQVTDLLTPGSAIIGIGLFVGEVLGACRWF